MMCRLTIKTALICILCFAFFSAAAGAATDTALAKDIAISKRLAKTPLIKGENYRGFERVDKELNLAYRTLSKTLDGNKCLILKQAQREWIEWRDTKCNAMQEAVHCGTSGCYGIVHDDCILQMTADRTIELRKFIKNSDEAVKQKFDFSRKNKHLDDVE